jgi:PhnB protein
MQLNPYLSFNGQCEAAFQFYEKVLGGKITFMSTHAGTPLESQVPKEYLNRIMHATLEVGDNVIMGADAPPDHYKKPTGYSISINLKDPVEAERLFNALADKGQVLMPIQTTFWAEKFGMLTDQYGTPWMINCEGRPAK